MALSNFEIEEIATKLKLPIVGVFCKDELPSPDKPRRQIGSYYVNLQSSKDGDGTHWTMFRIFEDHTAIYFDPFGLPPPQQVVSYLEQFKPIASSNRQIQDVKSQNCGYYCMNCDWYFTYDAVKGRPTDECFDDYLNVWSYDPKKNDKILKEYFNKY